MKRDQEGIITEVLDSRHSERLMELGFVPGAWFKVLQEGKHMIIQIGDSRIAMRRSLAKLIKYSPIVQLERI